MQHPRVPESQEFVRVNSYQSKMVIRPHKSFDEVSGECLAAKPRSALMRTLTSAKVHIIPEK